MRTHLLRFNVCIALIIAPVVTLADCTPEECGIVVPPAFSDVSSDHQNFEAVQFAADQGIVEGYEDGTYRPDQTINRAEFVKILIESQYIGSKGPGPEECLQDEYIFPDVPKTLWYAPFACVAMNKGYVAGYPDGLFHGERDINFVEAAKIISLAFDVAAPGIAPNDPWYAPYVRDLERHNAIPLSIMSFDQPITRGEMAEMIWRLKTGNNDKPSQTYEELIATTQRPQEDAVAQDVCNASPMYSESGARFDPSIQRFEHLHSLRGFFTAYMECSPERAQSLDPGRVLKGSLIVLHRAPTAELRKLLQMIGYQCTSGNFGFGEFSSSTDEACLQWQSQQDIPTRDALQLIPFVEEILLETTYLG